MSIYLGSCILKLVECIKFWVRLRTIQYCQITHTSHAHIEPSGGLHYCSYIHGGEEQAMRRYLQPQSDVLAALTREQELMFDLKLVKWMLNFLYSDVMP